MTTVMVEVTQKDANDYCRVLTTLGMEEEGDPVAEIETLRKDAERYRWLKTEGFAFAENVRVGAVTTAGADQVIDAKMYKVVAVG